MLIAPERLKLRTSNLTCMFPDTVRTWPLIFWKGSICKNSLGGDNALLRAPFSFLFFTSAEGRSLEVMFSPLSVRLFVRQMTQNAMNGFQWNFLERWGVTQVPVDWIFAAIRITIGKLEFFKGYLQQTLLSQFYSPAGSTSFGRGLHSSILSLYHPSIVEICYLLFFSVWFSPVD